MLPQGYIELFIQNDYRFITGVPDSIFKELLWAVNDDARFQHVISNNEGEACALAAGYHLATGKIPMVYMQNSGLGNSINPLTSLLDAEIYSIPALLLISWRGLPGDHDEPQHKRMGKILPGLCALLDIPYAIANTDPEKMHNIFKQASDTIRAQQKPFAILFPKNVIQSNKKVSIKKTPEENAIVRERVLEVMVRHPLPQDIFITTTGKTSRELYEIRERLQQNHSRDFLTVGSMGCASTIALGIAMQCPDRRVILVDGDGACLMRMEALATIGYIQPKNFLHIVIDNNAYESTGSQPTLSHNVDLPAIARACRYRAAHSIEKLSDFMDAYRAFEQGPEMLVVKTFPYSRPDLGRPTSTPIENKTAFMQYLQLTEKSSQMECVDNASNS